MIATAIGYVVNNPRTERDIPRTVRQSGATTTPRLELHRGQEIAGRYTLLRFLGAGGFGQVWLAMGPRGGKFVLKFEAGTFPGEDQLLAQSMRARLHAGIARLFGRVVINGVHCKVMEFVPGRTLRAWVQVEGYFDPITAVWLIKQAAEALACLHDMGMVHNDVKEENFMVTEEGQLKLIDPGLVAPLPCAWQCGTPEYKSPEKLNGATFDQRADIFSLGIVYYWMTKGLHPYDLTGDPTFNMQSVRANMQTGTLRPDIVDYPADIQGFIRRLVHVDPAQRFQSCEEVIAAADGILRRHSPSGGSGGN